MSIAIHWFRRDLRLQDNAALFHALQENKAVQCVFIFDTDILDKLEDENDARVTFIYQEIQRLKKELNELGGDLWVFYGKPIDIYTNLAKQHTINAIYTNRDYEPYAKKRDREIEAFLADHSIPFKSFKDHVIFEQDEIVKDDGYPYVVYTPYSKKWKAKLSAKDVESYATEDHFARLHQTDKTELITLEEMGFTASKIPFPKRQTTNGIIRNYEKNRNFPAIQGTSRLSVHFRFGTISIREKVRKAQSKSEKWLNELIWRDFYSQILHHFPRIESESFRPQYDAIQWRNNPEEFKAWCEGKTGFPIIDAGMRELNTTGFMHNRVRMIVASFLTKHLLIDWRWGEAYFARKLLDFDLASNNGGWQWASGSGVDAAPYFRIFNPHTQLTKFDKDLNYVKQWVPEYGTSAYPKEIVEHKMARERCLETYKNALNS
jgi:deoxyribodipyrimidine photo-lyase